MSKTCITLAFYCTFKKLIFNILKQLNRKALSDLPNRRAKHQIFFEKKQMNYYAAT